MVENYIKREDVIKTIDKINQAKKVSELKTLNSELIALLEKLPNFKSDSYQPIALATQLITQKQNIINQKRQFIINVLLAIVSIVIASFVAIIK